MAGETILVLGVIAVIIAFGGLIRPNIVIPGLFIGVPSAYVIYNDGIVAFLKIVGILVGLYLVLVLMDIHSDSDSSSN